VKVDKKLDFNFKCLDFYKEKTNERIELYYQKYYNKDSSDEIVNDNKLPFLKDLLDKVDWEMVSNGKPVRFHGDLHFENILIKKESDTLPFALVKIFILLVEI
jgi:aminoglycoside phosphotransferase (APT) family kinase protein